MWHQKQYDVIVVGAGPAGSTFSRIVADNGHSVLLLDRKKKIGTPVRCGEGVVESELRIYFDPRTEWIETTINKFQFIAPDGTENIIQLKENGFILDRTIFDSDLAKMAKEAGVEIRTEANVNDLLFDDDRVIGVQILHGNEQIEIKAKIVIGADGVESRIGRMAGIKTTLKLSDIDSAYQKTISGINVDIETCQFRLSNKIAPSGYIWVFPKSKNTANVGIAISGKTGISGESAKKRLDYFLESYFPNHNAESIAIGGIPIAKSMESMVTDNVMLIGDAARTVNPLSGGGIILGMKSAAIAADVASKVLEKNIEPVKANLVEYQNRWMRKEGKQISRIYNIKKSLYRITDDEVNNIFHRINKIPIEKRSIIRFLGAFIPQKPSILIDVSKAFMGY